MAVNIIFQSPTLNCVPEIGKLINALINNQGARRKSQCLNSILKKSCLVELNYHTCFTGANIRPIISVNIISCIIEGWSKLHRKTEE